MPHGLVIVFFNRLAPSKLFVAKCAVYIGFVFGKISSTVTTTKGPFCAAHVTRGEVNSMKALGHDVLITPS